MSGKLPADNLIRCFSGSTSECVKVLDSNATILSFNEYGLKLMEFDSLKDIVGKDWLKLWTGEVAPLAEKAFKKAIRGNIGYFEGYCPTAKGKPKWWQVNIVPLKNDRGEIDWILSLSRDVTELYNLRKENTQLKLLAAPN